MNFKSNNFEISSVTLVLRIFSQRKSFKYCARTLQEMAASARCDGTKYAAILDMTVVVIHKTRKVCINQQIKQEQKTYFIH